MTKHDILREQLRERLLDTEESLLPSRAELASSFGVSPATVSNVLRELKDEGWIRTVPGKGSFIVGSQLSADRKLVVGLTGSYFASGGHTQSDTLVYALMQGIQKAAREESCSLTMLPYEDGRCDLEMTRSMKLNGLLIAGGISEAEQMRIARSGIPAVLANYPAVPAPVLPFCDHDNAGALAETVRMMQVRGRKRIAFITLGAHSVPEYGRWLRERFIIALADAELEFAPQRYCRLSASGDHEAESRAAVSAMLEHNVSPDGVICWNQQILKGALAAVADKGLRVPEDISMAAACAAGDNGCGSMFVASGRGLGESLLKALRWRLDDPCANVSGFVKLKFIDGGSI